MKYALTGRVVTMKGAEAPLPNATVYIQDHMLAAVSEQGAPPPAGFEAVKPLPCKGTIFPGLIELHNHISYNLLPLWKVDKRYTNRNQWSGTPWYRANVTGPMRVLGGCPELLPALARYVECKCLVAGVTTTQGVAMFSNAGVRRYYKGVVRNVEQTLDPDLPDAQGRIADVEASGAAAFLARLKKETCLLLHLSEGTDDAARKHFLALDTGAGWAMSPALAGIHCVALKRQDFDLMAQHGASMVWSPTSNLLLYGQTADIAAARAAGIRIGLGADWSVSGSRNLLGELRMAWLASAGTIPARELVAMATCQAASILGWDKVLGTLEPGKRADLLVLAGTSGDPFEKLVRCDESDICLSVIDGTPRCGAEHLMNALGADGELVRIGGARRVLSLRDHVADPAIPYVSLAEAKDTLRDALRRLPALARRLEDPTLHRALAAGALHDGPPVWFLALDELGDSGASLRLQVAGPGPALAPPPMKLSELVATPALDTLAMNGDEGYWASLRGQKNLPKAIVQALA
jgi:hypothetical protein